MIKKILSTFILTLMMAAFVGNVTYAISITEETYVNNPSYLKAVISTEEAIEIKKSTIFDASQSFIPDPEIELTYEWDFGDGNKNEGKEVLHTYKEPGRYTVTLTMNDGSNISKTSQEVFAYRKLVILITDQTQARERIEDIRKFTEKEGVSIDIIESFGSSTEFISEEVLTSKIAEEANTIQKAEQIVIWTKENAGLNALSRYIQSNQRINLSQKTITILENDISSSISRIQKQFGLIDPKKIVIAKEAAIYPLLESLNDEMFTNTLEKGGYEFEVVNEKTGKLRPWNFMSSFVNILIDQGIPDNTIALLLLLPVIATVVAIMKQVVGITTFGIYTPSIITLSFLVIGMHAGLLTLLAAIIVATAARTVLKKVRMLFIPKMAIVITLVSLTLLLLLIASNYLGLFDAKFISIAIFPMLILSTLVEKFISVKSDKGLASAMVLMTETVLVAIVAYFIAGGEIDLGIFSFQFSYVKQIMITYPEVIIVLLIFNFLLGKWSGLRILERVRFREILRHVEE